MQEEEEGRKRGGGGQGFDLFQKYYIFSECSCCFCYQHIQLVQLLCNQDVD